MKSTSAMINQSLLEQDIAQIKFYGTEEYQSLNKVCSKLEESLNAYNSSLNTNLFLNNIDIFKSNVDTILGKRMEYANTLNRVIIQYNMLADDTNQRFGDIV